MKAFVITISSFEKSVQAAKRCIKSAKKYGLEVEMHEATTPKDRPQKILESKGIPPEGFHEVYSRTQNCMAAFCSHMSLWEKAIELNENIIIFEHDAVVTGSFPEDLKFDRVLTFSKPSYGKYRTPLEIGVQPLIQKPYFGGAHGYIVSPEGAKEMIETAKTRPASTDVFMNLQNFPWLEEYYPWFCIASDSFTTIQVEAGCTAKHRYGEGYVIEDVR
jgi:GR25 family glycosyltransferase involved in LPS biosynthesis